MRNLMLSTAMILPLMAAGAMAQDAATPATPAAPGTTAMPMGADATPAAEPAMDAEAAADEAEQAATEAQVAASGKVEQEQAANELRIDWISDTTVNAPDGTAIGDINDVIIDGDTGTVKAAVVGVGGFLGIGEKQIALPWDQLTINYDAQQITSDLTREEAEAAPEYVFRDRTDAPNMAGDATMTTTPAGTAGTMATTPATTADPAAATVPMTTPDAAAATTPATGNTGAPTPADTAETPATEPSETNPTDGDAVAPAN